MALVQCEGGHVVFWSTIMYARVYVIRNLYSCVFYIPLLPFCVPFFDSASTCIHTIYSNFARLLVS